MGNNVPKKNRLEQNAADQKLIDGLQKHAATITSLVIAGATMVSKDIIDTLQTRIDLSIAAQTARATWLAAVAADEAERAKTKTFASGLRQALLVAFAGQIDVLADFGLSPRKAAVISPEEKVARAEKAKATRAARHTMGKVAKLKITGENPTGSPATPAAAPAPIPPAVPATAPVVTPVTPGTETPPKS
jgi:hypothetical protein